jgi:hypothetical protein
MQGFENEVSESEKGVKRQAVGAIVDVVVMRRAAEGVKLSLIHI